tara:strand:- start:1240 stop:2649 length:1410 start_codon:yes stop_codon:yes gene_type:complete
MSSLENTIGEVIAEAADIQHKVPGKGDAAPAAMANPDADAEKNASKAAKDAGESTKEAPKTNAAPKGDSMEVVSDGQTKVEKDKAVNQEEVEVEDAPALEEMSKADLLKHAVNSMKEMKVEDIQALVSEGEDDDDEKSESLSRNALIRKVVESLKDQSIAEITDFIKELDNDSDDGKSKEMQKKTTKKEETEIEEASKEEETDEEEAEEEEESVKKEEVEIDMTDDINALVADEDLTEEFKAKAKTIFEAAVASKVKEELAEKEAKLEEETNQKIEEIKDDLTEKVDSYLNYVSESWVKENELAIERGLKSELTEDFISGLKKLFEEHYVEVPEDKFDVVEELANRLDEMEDKLNEEVANNITAQQDIEELQREKIISEASKDLADTQVEKLKALSEDIDFEDQETFVEKVSTLKESYFGEGKVEAVSDDSAVVSDDADFSGAGDVAQPVSESMSQYTAALTKFANLDK